MQTDIMINTVIVNCRKLEETKRQKKSFLGITDQRERSKIDERDRSGGISR